MSNSNFTLGADPELFIYDNSNKSFVSSHDIIPGTKESPHSVEKGAIQVDGVAAEFNIDPANSPTEFSNNIKTVLEQLLSEVKSVRPNCVLKATPMVVFSKKYFRKLPEKAKELGCTPDFNAYTGKQNPAPSTNKTFRTGAGHLHIGWSEYEDPEDKSHLKDCIDIVKQLDSTIFPLSMLWDSNSERRLLYGKMGSFRPKHFGVEWRPLSNAWVKDPDLHLWLFDSVKRALELLDEDTEMWDANNTHDTVEWLRQNPYSTMNRNKLLSYHDLLVEGYGFNPLPAYYLGAS